MGKIYKRPYLDSGVFIAWIKGEKVKAKDASGKEIEIDRGKIGESVLTLAEQQVFPIVISALTFAEVHKKRGKQKLEGDENQNVLDYFEHDFVWVVPVDRAIGEEANRLCRLYEGEGLRPNDAIHMACAKRAECDVLLSWDGVLNSIKDPDIKTEPPIILDLTPPQQKLALVPMAEAEDEPQVLAPRGPSAEPSSGTHVPVEAKQYEPGGGSSTKAVADKGTERDEVQNAGANIQPPTAPPAASQGELVDSGNGKKKPKRPRKKPRG